MSRVGKLPVLIPAGVEVAMKDDQISVKAAANVLHLSRNAMVNVVNEGGKLNFTPANESREANAMTGTMRQLVNNMVVGVTRGFEKKLTLLGVGYKAQATGSKLKAPTKSGPRQKSFCARSKSWTGERGKAARKRWGCR
jgi:large subunit ribosomal protein L6